MALIISGEEALDENGKRSTRDKRITRLLDYGDATANDPASILYQHTVFCRTGLPYRNPGDDVREFHLHGSVRGAPSNGRPYR